MLDRVRVGATVVKARNEGRGRAASVLFAGGEPLPSDAPFGGPCLVQERIDGDGIDRKLYVIGSHVRGLLRPWPRRAGEDAHPFRPAASLSRLARRVGDILGLELYGVDVIEGPRAPVVVDVNTFPSCRGVPGAPRLIAIYLSEVATRAARTH